MNRTATQTTIDWTYLERKGWINDAVLPKLGHADDGSTVSAGKMRAMLHHINEHLGKNATSWPSQERLAMLMGCSERTIRRTGQALQRLSLLIIETEATRNGRRNTYRLVWTEIQMLDPQLRARWLRMVRHGDESVAEEPDTGQEGPDMVTEGPDMVTEGPDMVTEGPDMVTEGPDMMSGEHIHYHTKNKSRTHPPLASRPRDVARRNSPSAAGASTGWPVVVSVLKGLGMGACGRAVTAAQRRELTPSDVLRLVERWERLRARQPDQVTPGWLYRWITGDSAPPPDEATAEPKPPPPMFSTPERNHLAVERIRAAVVKDGRRAGASEQRMQAVLERRLAAAGLPRDATSIAGAATAELSLPP
ncbi:hypothetical protein V7x_28520 [Crateriforma conspicua]|uniref:Helix-turn-helix domain-containing protein n=1 Tax=Crateriforma conspicua TaxID=2527996 RepID=A0A5C6G0X5_9PLAN|nr:helix-turn-helix domain-containing protein [Crateriforma conspicua]TWU67278.1 hypothetical protein V7x_28520 [Crateriforma conspicua]